MPRVHEGDAVRLQAEMRTAKPEDPLFYCQYTFWQGRHERACGLPVPRGEKYCGWHRSKQQPEEGKMR